MNDCELHELSVSAWLDDALDRDDQLELADHLVRCRSCRLFYAEARALGATLDRLQPGTGRGGELPDDVWHRISERVRPERRRTSPIPSWALRVAAALVVALGLAAALIGTTGGEETLARADVSVGSDAGRMSEARFVEMARELLSADPAYHQARYGVMEQVLRDTGAMEASREGLGPRIDGSRSEDDDELNSTDGGPA